MNHPRTLPELRDAELAGGGRLRRDVSELLRQRHCTSERLTARIQVDLLRGGGERLARRRVHQILPELHTGGQLAFPVRLRHGHVPYLSCELRCAIELLGGSHGRGAAQPDVDPQPRVA